MEIDNTSGNEIIPILLEEILHKVSSECSIEKPHLNPQSEYSEEYPLINWNKWLNERKLQVEKIIKKTNKQPSNVLMNRFENYRKIKERQQIIEYSKFFDKDDELRGGDTKFWKIPPKLKSVQNLGDCFATLPISERLNMNCLTYTGSPDFILEEKGIIEKKSSWMRSEYFQEKDISLVEDFIPELNELGVQGFKIQNSEFKIKENSIQKIFKIEEVEEMVKVVKTECILQIEEILLNENEKFNENLEINLIFEEETGKTKKVEMNFMNFGQKAIDFELISSAIEFPELPKLSKDKPVFFYNKNCIRIIPGQNLIVPIMFQSQMEGIFTDRLVLKSDPQFFEENFQLTINLFGNTINDENDCLNFEKEINSRIVKKEIEIIFSEILNKALSTPDVEINYFDYLSEEELFQLENQDPQLFFNYENVEKLKSIFKQISPNENWDLRTSTLRTKILEIEEENERKMLFDDFKRIFCVLRTPNFNSDNSENHRMVPIQGLIKEMISKVGEISSNTFKTSNHIKNAIEDFSTVLESFNETNC